MRIPNDRIANKALVLGPFSRKRIGMSRRGCYLRFYDVVRKGKSRSNDKYREYTRLACTGPYQLGIPLHATASMRRIHCTLAERLSLLIHQRSPTNSPLARTFLYNISILIRGVNRVTRWFSARGKEQAINDRVALSQMALITVQGATVHSDGHRNSCAPSLDIKRVKKFSPPTGQFYIGKFYLISQLSL